MKMYPYCLISELVDYVDDDLIAEVYGDGRVRPLVVYAYDKVSVCGYEEGLDEPITGRLKPSGSAYTQVIAQL
jgi:hypothetical protein